MTTWSIAFVITKSAEWHPTNKSSSRWISADRRSRGTLRCFRTLRCERDAEQKNRKSNTPANTPGFRQKRPDNPETKNEIPGSVRCASRIRYSGRRQRKTAQSQTAISAMSKARGYASQSGVQAPAADPKTRHASTLPPTADEFAVPTPRPASSILQPVSALPDWLPPPDKPAIDQGLLRES